MSKIDDILKIYECECGKKFIPRPDWMYKLKKNGKSTYYCSYTCYRNAGGDNGKQKNRY